MQQPPVIQLPIYQPMMATQPLPPVYNSNTGSNELNQIV